MSLFSSSLEERESLEAEGLAERPARRWKERATALAAALAWAATAGVTLFWPDQGDWGRGQEFAIGAAAIAVVFGLAAIIPPRFDPTGGKLYGIAPWGIASGMFFTVWQALTAKTALLPMPFFSAAAWDPRGLYR